jgi:hypothetical protein
MNDPHVESLQYRIDAVAVEYQTPPPVTVQRPEFRILVSSNRAVVEMIGHTATEEDARTLIEPYLRAWEIWAAANDRHSGVPMIFVFEGAEIVDRRPDPTPGSVSGAARLSRGVRRVPASISVTVVATAYPSAPQGFEASPDVEVMWLRWNLYRQGREPLASMAYFCLTVIEASVRGKVGRGERNAAAGMYGIGRDVLDRLGELVSVAGAASERRKQAESAKGQKVDPYKQEEIRWMEAVVKALIVRIGERAFDPSQAFTPLTKSDFP